MIAKEIRHITNMASTPYVRTRRSILKITVVVFQDISTMFEAPPPHSQGFAGFGRQASTDSAGTIRRHQTATRLSVMANAKRVYDEVMNASIVCDWSLLSSRR